jgi:hypothetical protein
MIKYENTGELSTGDWGEQAVSILINMEYNGEKILNLGFTRSRLKFDYPSGAECAVWLRDSAFAGRHDRKNGLISPPRDDFRLFGLGFALQISLLFIIVEGKRWK